MKKKCKHKSLLDRIRFIVNIATVVSIVTMAVFVILAYSAGLEFIEKNMSEYYIDNIENIISASVVEMNNEVTITEKPKIVEEVQKLHRSAPYLTIEVIINQQYIYKQDGRMYVMNTLEEDMDKEELEYFMEEDIVTYVGELAMGAMYTKSGESYASIHIGIDNRLRTSLYTGIIILTALLGLGVVLIMRIFTKMLTKPILKPLNRLNEQLNQLADEEFDTMAPTLEAEKRTVSEVYDLTQATNRLLKKMINYNEVITQSEKMASVGQLTAAITHEINTPLGAINANANMIKLIAEAMTDDIIKEQPEEIIEFRDQIVESAQLSEQACERIDKIVRSLKLYSRIDQADFMPANINDSIKSVIILTTNLHKNRIKINENYGDIPEVACHIGLINQVFMNIFINAIQAIDNKGDITITTTADEENVYAWIRDTGCGISKKNVYNIFQYGFTTKQPGSGSGIGLALSNNIIKKHNGKISVDSIEGQGATFMVTLPIKQENAVGISEEK